MLRYVHSVTGQEHFRQSTERYLKEFLTVGGYKFVQLRKNGRPNQCLIHRLVAVNFIENLDTTNVVNHKDGNKLNNTVDNLEWCTDRYNHEHATANGLKARGSEIGTSVLNEKCVFAIKKLISMGWSHGQISKLFDVSRPTITLISNGDTWRHVALTGTELQVNL